MTKITKHKNNKIDLAVRLAKPLAYVLFALYKAKIFIENICCDKVYFVSDHFIDESGNGYVEIIESIVRNKRIVSIDTASIEKYNLTKINNKKLSNFSTFDICNYGKLVRSITIKHRENIPNNKIKMLSNTNYILTNCKQYQHRWNLTESTGPR